MCVSSGVLGCHGGDAEASSTSQCAIEANSQRRPVPERSTA